MELVVLVVVQRDNPGVFGCSLPDDLIGPICRSVVQKIPDPIRVCLLQNTLDGSLKRLFCVVRGGIKNHLLHFPTLPMIGIERLVCIPDLRPNQRW